MRVRRVTAGVAASTMLAAGITTGTVTAVNASSGQQNVSDPSTSHSASPRASKKKKEKSHAMWFGHRAKSGLKTTIWLNAKGTRVVGVGAQQNFHGVDFCFKGTLKGKFLKGKLLVLDPPGQPRRAFKWSATGSGKKFKLKRIRSNYLDSTSVRKLKKKATWSSPWINKQYYRSACRSL